MNSGGLRTADSVALVEKRFRVLDSEVQRGQSYTILSCSPASLSRLRVWILSWFVQSVPDPATPGLWRAGQACCVF